ncbi:MAG: helix-turn-helix domain-containing protein [bacterium]|nr:helix-turn-helix domain-containing protein [bacterium]
MSEEPQILENTAANAVMPGEDFSAIGRSLLAKREELSYTLEHVAEITRITLSNLRAIEDGEMDKLPGLVFVRGFVRNYANLLGLDSDWMVDVLNRVYGHHEDALHAAKMPVRSGLDLGQLNLSHLGLLAGAFVVILLIGYFMSSNQSGEGPVQQAVQAVESTQEAGVKDLKKQEQAIQTAISPLNLVLVAKADEWVSVAKDGERSRELLLEKGKKYEFPADDYYQVVMTSGSSASIYLNGEELEIPKDQHEKLYQSKLNKFSLTRMNN